VQIPLSNDGGRNAFCANELQHSGGNSSSAFAEIQIVVCHSEGPPQRVDSTGATENAARPHYAVHGCSQHKSDNRVQ